MLLQYFSVIVDRDIRAPGHGIELVYGLNATERMFLLQFISTVQVPGEKGYDTQMVIVSGTHTYDVSLAI